MAPVQELLKYRNYLSETTALYHLSVLQAKLEQRLPFSKRTMSVTVFTGLGRGEREAIRLLGQGVCRGGVPAQSHLPGVVVS